jgi:NAD(P)-dependent dehydrogenase (short-subunit alcohol dehydrogenase family)
VDDVLRYAGQRVIVTGAAAGTGAAVTSLLVELGAEVHAIDAQRPDTRLLASFTETDLREPEQIEAAAAKIGGIVNALFHCARAGASAPVADAMAVEFDALRDLVDHVAPNMIPGSAIASATTASSERAVAEYTASSAPALAAEHGIRLNCVCVGDHTADEAAWALLFLNSPRSSLVTGAALLAPR